MALGVLNNLSAIYAENNLNNTNNSLQTVLQQLSSGSRINSGADDAAGLSLVNGLEANQTALTQSETNATEGVGLLQVADGALSQVTNLLNRAITLATEASNGTLNSTQEGAANQEYQSILSEVNNIGQTTTYNQQQVFNGQNVAIYTGDSSAAGSSIDDLNIRNLSEASMGDTGGVMAYSDGSNSVFINLSHTNGAGQVTNAQDTDTLNANGTTTINVAYLVKGANGTESTATTSISVGGTTGIANTANGLIDAINSAGLGLTASFTTQAQAGLSGGGTQTGIQITGGLVSAGVDPGAASTSGILNPAGISNEELTLGQTITVKVGGETAASVTIGSSTSTLTGLMNAINTNVGGAVGTEGMVTASIITNGDGSQSLSLADTPGNGALTVTSAPNPLGPNALSNGTDSTNPVSLSFTNDSQGRIGTDATATLGINGTNTPGDLLTGSIVLSNNQTPGASPMIFVMGAGAASGTIAGTLTGGNTYTVNGDTLGNLATAIQTELGVTAAVGSSGITMTSNTAGTTLEYVTGAGNNTLKATPALTVSNNQAWTAANPGTEATATLTMNGGGGPGFAPGTEALTGTLVLQNGDAGNAGVAQTFVMGGVSTGATIGVATETVNGLLGAITSDGALGISTASVNASNQIVLTAGTVGTTITATSNINFSDALSATPTPGDVGALSTGAQVATGGASTTSDTLTGNLVLTNDGVTDTFTMGGSSTGANTIVVGTGGQNTATMQQLLTALNGTNDAALGITAALNPVNGTISFTSAISTDGAAPNIGVTSTLADAYSTQFTTPAEGQALNQHESGTLDLVDGGQINTLGGALTGTLTLTNDTALNGGGYTATFVFGQGASDSVNAGTNTWDLSDADSNLVGLEDAINGTNTGNPGGGAFNGAGAAGTAANLDITASTDLATGGMFLQSTALATIDTNLSASTSLLTDSVTEAPTAGTGGAATATAQVVYSDGLTNQSSSDPVSGTITLTNSGLGAATTFVVGTGNTGVANTYYTSNFGSGAATLGNLATAISQAGIGLDASVGTGGLTISVAGDNFGNSITKAGSLTDIFGATTSGQSGDPLVVAENASATVGTTGIIQSTDNITGNIVLQNNGGPGGTQTFTMGSGVNSGNNHFVGGTTIGALAQAISDSTLGIEAQVNVTTGALELQSSFANTNIVATSNLNDTVAEGVSLGSPDPGLSAVDSSTTLSLGSGTLQNGDVLTGSTPNSTGSITIMANGNTETFVMGATAHNVTTGGLGTLLGSVFTVNGNTVADLENAINGSTGVNGLNITASNTNSDGNLLLKSDVANGNTISISGNTLQDAFSNPASVASLGTFASTSDTVAGTVSFDVGSTPEGFTISNGETVQGLVNQINKGDYGVSASLTSTNANTLGTSTSDGFYSLTLTSNTYGTAGEIENTGTLVRDIAPTAMLNYVGSAAYNTGLSSGSIESGTAIYDSSSGQTDTPTGVAGIISNANGSSGIATISYSDGAGQALNGTDLSNQTDAETALNSLNLAISDVASQDGYIGAQINTLNSISQVMSTQQENVVSAQNAIQATDYASATSNMSKYEILSQTGIAALAQANTVQQEVTKLLQ